MSKYNVFPMDFDRKVTLSGSNVYPSPELFPDRVLPEHELLFITSGTWSAAVEDEIYQNLTAGDMLFLRAGVRHRGIAKCSMNARTQYVRFSTHRQDRRVLMETDTSTRSQSTTAYVAFPTLVHCNDCSGIEELMNKIYYIYWGQRGDKQRTLGMLLNLLLNEISYMDSMNVPRDHEWCSALIRLFMEHPAETYSVEELAERMEVHPRTLSDHFYRVMGTTIRQYQINLKLEQAYAALCGSGIPVKNIAEQFGFCDAYYFSRMFKKKYGFSPANIKKKAPGENRY